MILIYVILTFYRTIIIDDNLKHTKVIIKLHNISNHMHARTRIEDWHACQYHYNIL